MTPSERAWAQGWSVIPGLDNPAGIIIQREIRRWRKEGRTHEDYSSSVDLCGDLDLRAWDERLGVGLRRAGSEPEPLHHGDADAVGDEDRNRDLYAYHDAESVRHRNALARLAHAIIHGDES